MSKIIYNQITGEVASIMHCDDPEREMELLKLNIPAGHDFIEVVGVMPVDKISVDVETKKIKDKK